MTYLTQNAIAENVAMRNRVAQAVAQEGITPDADSWTYNFRRTWASAPGWDAAWESALVAAPGADPGINEAVITDGMILSQVQAMPAAPPA
jgi:hypothetical protein